MKTSPSAPDPRLAFRDARGMWRSEGMRRLILVAGASKRIVVASQLGVTERYASMLLRGERQPSADVIARIWLAFGIEGHAWGLAPLPASELPVQRSSSTNGATSGECAA